MINQSALATWGIKSHQFILAGFVLGLTLISVRMLMICRNPFQISMVAYALIIAIGLSALALGWIPRSRGALPLLTTTIVQFLFWKKRPLRMDYSLFLRAAHGLLKCSGEADDLPQIQSFDRHELLVFARFLGARFLVINFRWETSGLALRLAPVRGHFLTNIAMLFLPPISQNCSHISLSWEGALRADCGNSDKRDLAALKTIGLTNPQELECLVEENVRLAWQEFRRGNFAAAEMALGDPPESEVFVMPPSREKFMRWGRILVVSSVALMMACMMFRFLPSAWMARPDGLKAVDISKAQVLAFLNDTTANSPAPRFKFNGPALALFTCLVLPSTNLFSPLGLRAMRDEVCGARFEASKHGDMDPPANFGMLLMRRALAAGWLSWDDLDIRPEDEAMALRTNSLQMYSPEKWEYLLTPEAGWSWVKSERFKVMRIGSDGLTQLRLLRSLNCLDLIDGQKLIQQIASVQVLSATPSGQSPMHDWKAGRGLFFTPCYPALQDTYYSLATLEIRGGLDKIDREACINGILSRHQGKGYFTSPDSGGYNEYHIDGGARDTIAAFESLRLLGALNRVKDLEQWQFRPQRRGIAKGQLTWQDVEAWVCRQRLEKILRQIKEDPQTRAGSLLTGG